MTILSDDPTLQDERNKYQKIWDNPNYRITSPGLRDIAKFYDLCKPADFDSIIDFGCGTGKAAWKLYTDGHDVTMVDIAPNCLDEEIAPNVDLFKNKETRYFRFYQSPLWKVSMIVSPHDWVFCCDVMEHLPGERIDEALSEARRLCRKGAYFQIALFPHKMDGMDLHLTVKGVDWWLSKLNNHFKMVESEYNDRHLRVFAS